MCEVILVGGPNGAGKTTFIESYLKDGDYTYLGADQIAYELCPENVESVAVEAGRIFVKRILEYQKEPRNLIIESTLSGRSLARHIEKFRKAGCSIRMIFISIPSASVSAARVKLRVKKGGHNVPVEDLERRFLKTHRNFWEIYRPLANKWFVYFNEIQGHELIAAGQGGCYVEDDEAKMREFLWKLEE